jgi:1,2-diacylglycerol 3-beta-galactosyltransferase
LTGAPVHPKFTRVTITKHEAKQMLGWDETLPTVLLIGGGDGMGPLVETAMAIDQQQVQCQLVVIAGRNEAMKARLDAIEWRGKTKIYGFVNNMEVVMTAADALVTKAGPGTITEAATIGLPLILSGAIRFQESPNTEYVVQQGAGMYAPGPERVAATVAELFNGNHHKLKTLARGVRKLANPDAIWQIADEIHARAPKNK